MALLGNAALVLSFAVDADAFVEHDDWHTHEHLHERLAIPGFVRGSRWLALVGEPRYFVLYEVAEIGVLASAAYLERLNHPSPWTTKMMPHYRGMQRGFCALSASFGSGLGRVGLVVRFSPATAEDVALREWLRAELLPSLPARPGLVSAHLFEAALTPAQTQEQRLRGKDAGLDWVLLVTGYDQPSVAALAARELSAEALVAHGAADPVAAIYELDYALTDREAAV